MKNALTRRQVLKAGGAALAGLYAAGLLGGCAGSGAGGTQMRMTWWGSTVRHERTKKALKIYEKKNSGVKITPEPIGDFDEYWNKLATQASGGNAPDVIQTDYRYLTEYAGRGVLMELDEYIPDTIDLSNFDEGQVENGQIDGKTYALSFGDNAQIVAFDVARFEDAGLEPPSRSWTWDDFAETARQLSEAGGEEFYGVEDAGGVEPLLEIFAIQRGQSLYDGKQLGFDEATYREWLTYWEELRSSGAAAPGDLQATDTGDLNTTLLIRGKAAMDLAFSNQYTGLAELTERELDLTAIPSGGSEPGMYLKPSQLLSGYSRSDYQEEIAQVINFFLNDEEANRALGTERGISGNAEIRDMLRGEVPETELKVFDYLSFVRKNAAPLPPPPPMGAGEIEELILRTNQNVAFGRASIDQAVAEFFTQAESALEKANQ